MNEQTNQAPAQQKGKLKVGTILDVTVEKMRAMADASTIIGDPIVVDGITMIPVSKVTYGFASGGSDFASKKAAHPLFAGGGGGGMTVTPVAFMVVADGEVKLLNIQPTNTPLGAAERAITMAPELIEQIKKLFQKDKKETAE
ncbi:MAG: sporulation protein YtfJ [Clostridia bacterium]|nr:sporulation protein YtfJ [Clostridia bacterium]